MSRIRGVLSASSLVAGLACLSACSGGGPTADHIVLITVDTLRADHLGCYGYEAADTPAIDGLAGESIRFEHAWSTAPLTLPSHASMLTGQVPFEHDLRNNDLIRREGSEPMVQELLRARGYTTAAVVSAFVLDSGFGLAAGFDHYIDDFVADGPQERPGDEVTDLALGLLDEIGDGAFFLWVHYFDPHHPYAEGYASPLEGYDAEIRFVDAEIGRLLDGLKTRGLYDDAAIVLASDHGEAFGEHGETEHGYFIYDVTTRVPLLLRLPGAQHGGTQRAQSVCVTDLFPTLLELGGASPPDRVHARSLFSGGADDERAFYAETLSPFVNQGASPLASIRKGGWKYIEAPEPELYDRSTDPGELENLHAGMTARALELRAELMAMNDLSWMTSADPLQDVTSDPATRERLAALGYVSSGGDRQAGWRPDPKHLIRTQALVAEGDRALARGDSAQAQSSYRRALDLVPSDWKSTWKLGDLLQARGKLDAAEGVFREAIQLESRNLGARVRLALVLLDQGDAPAALEQLDLTIAGASSYVPARVYRAGTLRRLGRMEEARAEVEAVLALDPENAEALSLARQLGM